MKAAVVHVYGGPGVLVYEEFPDPVPGPGQVLVKMAATSVNPIDFKRRSGAAKGRFPIEFPGVLGVDVAGTIVQIGTGVDGFAVGDAVLAMAGATYAELCAVNASSLVKLPDGLDLVEAAAMPLVTTTGHEVVSLTAEVRAGQTVIIIGAGGMVGRSAVYTAKRRGAYVIGAVRAIEAGMAEEIGADHLVATGDESALASLPVLDAVVDAVGGDVTAAFLPNINEGGVYASVLGPSPFAAQYPRVRSVNLGAQPNAGILSEMALAVRDGNLSLPIGMRLSLSEAAKAHALAENHATSGKILLTVDDA